MGIISKKIKSNLLLHINKKVINIEEVREAKKEADAWLEEVNSVQTQINNEELDSTYKAYVTSCAFIGSCMYQLVNLKEMSEFKKISMSQEDLYMPSFPPMSPLTDSYYNLWELFDLTFGPDKESLTSIFLDLADVFKIEIDQVNTITTLSNSRMGIYEVCEYRDNKILLKELVTNTETWCICPAGYKGKTGQIWFARILPPISNFIEYSVVLTTPYVLLTYSKDDWNDFFTRNNIDKNNFHTFMKFGNGILPNLWNEFIFYGYYNYTDQAIFLSGIPDMDSTLPCHDNFSLNSEEKLSNESSNGLSEDDRLDFSDVPNVLSILEDEEFHELPEQLNGRKASEVFLDFSMPLLETIINDESNELDDIADSLMVPWMVWNASVYEFLNDKNEIHLSELMKKMPKDKQFREMISFFAKRKKEMFGQYNYILGEYSLIPKEEGGFNLTMASML